MYAVVCDRNCLKQGLKKKVVLFRMEINCFLRTCEAFDSIHRLVFTWMCGCCKCAIFGHEGISINVMC